MGKDHLDQEWENRVLCSDESCIGVIGPDGCCKECGLVYEGELPAGLSACPENADTTTDILEDNVAPEPSEEPADLDSSDPSDDEWANRKLCRDESCIGVIGPDGRCKECGLAYDELGGGS
jgi:rubredoxin